jgi:diguanylate cyclase (GGDEF)-like protein
MNRWCVLLLLVVSSTCAWAARPLSSTIRPDVDIYPQFFALAQGVDRMLYVGATDAVLRFDGARWTRIDMPRPGPVRALLLDRDGRVWVGATDCFGYLERDAAGRDRFVDVAPAFVARDGVREFADTWDAIEHGDAIWFLGLRHLFAVDRAGLPVGHWSHRGRFGGIAAHDGRLVVQFRGEGLRVLEGDRFTALPGGERYANPVAYNLVPLGANRLLVHDSSRIEVLENGRSTSVAIADATELAPHLTQAAPLPDGRIAFGGDDGTLRVLDLAAPAIETIAVGESFLSDVVLDRDGALWVVADDGLTRFAWPPAWRAYGREDGLTGSVLDVALVGERLFALSGSGVFEAPWRDGAIRGPFLRRPWTVNEAWSLHDAGDALLLAESHAVFEVGEAPPRRIGPDDLYPRTFLRSPHDPRRLWVGTESGVAAFVRGDEGWTFVASTDLHARSLTLAESSPGELWVGSEDRGLIRVDFDPRSAIVRRTERIGTDSGLDLGGGAQCYVDLVDGALHATTLAGRFRLAGDRFVRVVPDPLVALAGGIDAPRIVAHADGTQWAWTFRRAFRRTPGAAWETMETAGVERGSIEALLPVPGGGVLMGTSHALLHYAGGATRPREAEPPRATITSVALEQRGRTSALPLAGARVPYGAGTLVFSLGFTDYGSAERPQFQVRMSGLDRGWSEWGERASVGYGALPPGEYVFEARARRQAERIVAGARFAFVVVPRWYQRASVQALALGTVAVALALILTWRQRRRLARLGVRAAELDSLVQERTVELEAVNRKLRELAERDGLTSVGNRRRFDAALTEHFALAAAGGPSLSLLLLDVDHFKAFNDAHGHLAGDELLKRIAEALVRSVREDTTVARYGGEEFALVAPSCDIEQAGVLAERLRSAAAALSPGITVSVGVATYDSVCDREPSDLVQRADAALYRAKHLCRNRFECAGA